MYIAYYRVSTIRQGASGLGLDAQKTAVQNYAGDAEIIASYTDIESGGNDTRTELHKAIKQAEQSGAILLIAKLDRLSRNVRFISELMDSKIKFVCCDMPEANEFTINIFAAMAQQERKVISERTRLALSEKKKAIGEWRKGSIKSYQHLGVAKIKANAKANINTLQATEVAKSYHATGATLQEIANKLNELQFKTARGKSYQKTSVLRLLK